MSELTLFLLAFPCGLFFRFALFLANKLHARLTTLSSVLVDFVFSFLGALPLFLLAFFFRHGVITFYPVCLLLLTALLPIKTKLKKPKKSKTP
ncbi:MAG: hypothetical protein IJX06_03975 [Clostridia bacterium]|nr:hypothetical protein [Clostridia bacterium]